MALLRTLARVDKLIWTLIFGGLLGVVLGLSVDQRDETLGGWLILGGLLAVALGAALVYVRSRMTEPPAAAAPPR